MGPLSWIKDSKPSAEGRKRKASELAKTPEGTDEALGELVWQAGEARGDSGIKGPVESSICEEYLQQCKEKPRANEGTKL